ncbi:condensation domain-containing protein [Streptomyces galbus]|uniref:condensation domain-containing protein n=1 Tax=Streptomyces galbus TaxID=33898 RepID=UPI003EC08B5A
MLLEPDPARPAAASLPTRIVLTYHRALIDTWSAHLLLREFYRAYLAGGTLPGGERRPDLRDYSAWLAAQDRDAGREFTARTSPPAPAASRPARPAPATALSGVGRARLRLDTAETSRLAHWAGRWGTTESSVLQAVWAMLIYRACGTGGPAPVSFAVSVSGRGIPLEGADRMPGPLRNALPVHLDVDPAHTVPRLLRTLRDRALDLAAYEWVHEDFLHPDHTGTGTGAAQAGTLIVFEDPRTRCTPCTTTSPPTASAPSSPAPCPPAPCCPWDCSPTTTTPAAWSSPPSTTAPCWTRTPPPNSSCRAPCCYANCPCAPRSSPPSPRP